MLRRTRPDRRFTPDLREEGGLNPKQWGTFGADAFGGGRKPTSETAPRALPSPTPPLPSMAGTKQVQSRCKAGGVALQCSQRPPALAEGGIPGLAEGGVPALGGGHQDQLAELAG